MDDPTHTNENQFWDDVADWVLESDYEVGDFTEADVESMLRDLRDDQDPF